MLNPQGAKGWVILVAIAGILSDWNVLYINRIAIQNLKIFKVETC
jgi:hypothetical protein